MKHFLNVIFKYLMMMMVMIMFSSGQNELTCLCFCFMRVLRSSRQVIEYNPSQCLDWLAVQTPRNKLAHSWVLQNMENWVERFLLAHNYPRVRTCKNLNPSVSDVVL